MLLGVGAVVWVRRPRRTRVDVMARRLAPHSQMTGVTPVDVARTAARLRPGEALNGPDDHGLPIGKTVPGAVTIRQGWEDCSVIVAGPRTGKSTAAAIPAVTAAPGAVAVTSNKADVHDATRGVRSGTGTVWLFDPQGIADTSRVATWWWNPLAPVTSLAPAKGLAAHFVSNSRDASARTDAYFDGGAQGLLATYLLAASLGGGDVLHVLEWLYDDTDLTPARLLAAHGNPMAAARLLAAHGNLMAAARVMATTNLRPAQKDGLYDGLAGSWKSSTNRPTPAESPHRGGGCSPSSATTWTSPSPPPPTMPRSSPPPPSRPAPTPFTRCRWKARSRPQR